MDSHRFTLHLKDLVRLATAAHRNEGGDLIWYTWTGTQRKQLPGRNSGLVALTPVGAAAFLKVVETAYTELSEPVRTKKKLEKTGRPPHAHRQLLRGVAG